MTAFNLPFPYLLEIGLLEYECRGITLKGRWPLMFFRSETLTESKYNEKDEQQPNTQQSCASFSSKTRDAAFMETRRVGDEHP